MESFTISEIFPISTDVLFQAWLDSDVHAEMIGSSAEIDPIINGKFYAWDNYITGTTIEIEKNKRIVQKWRTDEFPVNSPDSIVELVFTDIKGVTKLSLTHSQIPDGQASDYKQGWIDHYFSPMKEYFE